MKKSDKRQVTTDKCPHKHQVLRTIGGHCTVVITAVFCQDCGKQLTKTKSRSITLKNKYNGNRRL